MKTLQDIWKALDGHKTNIAMELVLCGQILEMFDSGFLVEIWHHQPLAWIPQVVASINWFATLLGGTGLVHQAAKSAAVKNLGAANDEIKSELK